MQGHDHACMHICTIIIIKSCCHVPMPTFKELSCHVSMSVSCLCPCILLSSAQWKKLFGPYMIRQQVLAKL